MRNGGRKRRGCFIGGIFGHNDFWRGESGGWGFFFGKLKDGA